MKNLPANAGDTDLIPGSGRSPGIGNSNSLQYPCLGNPMDRRTWQATVHGVTKSQSWLSNWAQSVSSVTQLCPTLRNPWITARQASLSITNSWSLLKLISIESVMPSSHLIIIPFSSCPQSFPASGSFQMSQFFAWSGQSLGVSALISVFPMNILDWFPLGWTHWIFLQSKGLSRVFSNTTVQKHQFFSAQLSL